MDILKLQNLMETNDFKRVEKSGYLSFIKKQAEYSYEYITKYFQGIYYFYYLSSDTDELKGDPFIIKPNILEKIVEVYKGNSKSSVNYFGIALLNNNHTITIQLAEKNDSPEEYIQLVVSIPFIRKVEYFRGIFSNLNFARQPIARKVVLHKVSELCEWEIFDALPVKQFSRNDEEKIPQIERYLCAEFAKIECYALPKPTFKFTDLDEEVNLIHPIMD